jgi:hypothetical protein
MVINKDNVDQYLKNNNGNIKFKISKSNSTQATIIYKFKNEYKELTVHSVTEIKLFILFYESEKIYMYDEFNCNMTLVPAVGNHIQAVHIKYNFKIKYKDKIFYVIAKHKYDELELKYINLVNYYRSLNNQSHIIHASTVDDFIDQFRSLNNIKTESYEC